MGSLPFAFSVHHFINSVGSDAGFAAIIGLAILVLLYFAQARETSTLRDHAEEAAQRLQYLEARVAQLSRAEAEPAEQAQPALQGRPGQATQPPPRVVPEVAPAASRVAPAPVPVAPAGVAAPALAAATRLIPTPAPAAVAASPVPDATVIGAGAVSAPATVAGGANGSGKDSMPPVPRPVSAPVASRPVSAQTMPPSAPPRVQIRPGAPAPPRRQPPRSGRPRGQSPLGRILIVVAGVATVAAIVVALILLTSSGGNSNSSGAQGRTTNSPSGKHAGRQPAVAPSSVTVAVLNGTPTAGLAKRVALNLGTVGYRHGTVTNAADQTITSTTVAYLPGYHRDAVAVAKSLKLGSSAAVPIDQTTQAVACPPPAPCTANVVVTVGSDLANTQ